MRGLLLLLVHVLAVLARLAGPGGVRGLVAENVLLKQQLLVLGRARRRAPNLTPPERLVLGLCTLLVSPGRWPKIAAGVRPSTLLGLHKCLVRRKYQALFSSRRSANRPGPKGPSEEIIELILELKRRNPSFGCPRIALIVATTFGVGVDKDVVRRVLAKHLRAGTGGGGPRSRQGQLVERGPVPMRVHPVEVALGPGRHGSIHAPHHRTRGYVGGVDGPALCRMFNRVIARQSLPAYLSTDHDPLFRYHRWEANLRILDIEAIKSVPYTPTSHPFVERMIGTVHREFLDQTLFWNSLDLERKLSSFREFREYFNESRVHSSLGGKTPTEVSEDGERQQADLRDYRWEPHCGGLMMLPIAA
jgi:transposase InsO family protein